MARTPSSYAVAILSGLGAWAKPWAATGALAALGFCLFLSRRLGVGRRRLLIIFTAVVLASSFAYLVGYSSIFGALTFWLPATALVTFTSVRKVIPYISAANSWAKPPLWSPA